MTLSTPLSRLFFGQWEGSFALHLYARMLLGSELFKKLQSVGVFSHGNVAFFYPKEGEIIPSTNETVGPIDKTFMIHVVSALLWVLTSYILICHSSKRSHQRYMGVITCASFILHCFATLNVIYQDIVRHSSLTIIWLISTLVCSIQHFVIAMGLVLRRKGKNWQQEHKDHMMVCYMQSTKGAGSIRTVAHIQEWLGVGVHFCLAKSQGISSDCEGEANSRLLYTDLLAAWIWGIYVFRMRKDAKLLKGYIADFKRLVISIIVWESLDMVFDRESLIHRIFGAQRSLQGCVILCLFTVWRVRGSVAAVLEFFRDTEAAPKQSKETLRDSRGGQAATVTKRTSSTLKRSKRIPLDITLSPLNQGKKL